MYENSHKMAHNISLYAASEQVRTVKFQIGEFISEAVGESAIKAKRLTYIMDRLAQCEEVQECVLDLKDTGMTEENVSLLTSYIGRERSDKDTRDPLEAWWIFHARLSGSELQSNRDAWMQIAKVTGSEVLRHQLDPQPKPEDYWVNCKFKNYNTTLVRMHNIRRAGFRKLERFIQDRCWLENGLCTMEFPEDSVMSDSLSRRGKIDRGFAEFYNIFVPFIEGEKHSDNKNSQRFREHLIYDLYDRGRFENAPERIVFSLQAMWLDIASLLGSEPLVKQLASFNIREDLRWDGANYWPFHENFKNLRHNRVEFKLLGDNPSTFDLAKGLRGSTIFTATEGVFCLTINSSSLKENLYAENIIAIFSAIPSNWSKVLKLHIPYTSSVEIVNVADRTPRGYHAERLFKAIRDQLSEVFRLKPDVILEIDPSGRERFFFLEEYFELSEDFRRGGESIQFMSVLPKNIKHLRLVGNSVVSLDFSGSYLRNWGRYPVDPVALDVLKSIDFSGLPNLKEVPTNMPFRFSDLAKIRLLSSQKGLFLPIIKASLEREAEQKVRDASGLYTGEELDKQIKEAREELAKNMDQILEKLIEYV